MGRQAGWGQRLAAGSILLVLALGLRSACAGTAVGDGGHFLRYATKVCLQNPGGRFWCVEIRFGDSHNYTKISFSLDGVPPYLARSPEEWFNPETGEVPQPELYDDDTFMQFARSRKEDGWSGLENFSPCPALGDPDGAEVRGDAAFALWNPEDRPLKFKVGSYLPRDMGTNTPRKASVKITGSDGKTVLVDRQDSIEHLHGAHGAPELLPPTGKGVARVQIAGVERWMAFTYPATPLVLIGHEAEGGWSRFSLEGKIWHLRGDIGSGTIMQTSGGQRSARRTGGQCDNLETINNAGSGLDVFRDCIAGRCV